MTIICAAGTKLEWKKPCPKCGAGAAETCPVAYQNAMDEMTAQQATISRLTEALEQCAARFATPPGTVSQCQQAIAVEFQRRMDIAGNAIATPRVADAPASSIDHQQRQGRHADIIQEALNTYDEWMKDDDYDATRKLREIMWQVRCRFNDGPTPAVSDAERVPTNQPEGN